MDRLGEIEYLSIGYSGHKISFVGKFEQTVHKYLASRTENENLKGH